MADSGTSHAGLPRPPPPPRHLSNRSLNIITQTWFNWWCMVSMIAHFHILELTIPANPLEEVESHRSTTSHWLLTKGVKLTTSGPKYPQASLTMCLELAKAATGIVYANWTSTSSVFIIYFCHLWCCHSPYHSTTTLPMCSIYPHTMYLWLCVAKPACHLCYLVSNWGLKLFTLTVLHICTGCLQISAAQCVHLSIYTGKCGC